MPTLALAKATSLDGGRVRPLAWCSRPRNSTALLDGALAVFDNPTSRYFDIETAELTVLDADGEPRVVRYVRRRFIAGAPSSTTLVSHAIVQGERLDHLAARYLGDPTQFWRVCDANDVLSPEELTREVGIRIRIALPLL